MAGEKAVFGVLILCENGFDACEGQDLVRKLCQEGYDARCVQVEMGVQTRWHDWIACARGEYARLLAECERVAVAGMGFGCALAMLLAEEFAVEALVLIDPHFQRERKPRAFDRWRLLSRVRLGAFAVDAPSLVILQEEDRAAARVAGVLSPKKMQIVPLKKGVQIDIAKECTAFLRGACTENEKMRY